MAAAAVAGAMPLRYRSKERQDVHGGKETRSSCRKLGSRGLSYSCDKLEVSSHVLFTRVAQRMAGEERLGDRPVEAYSRADSTRKIRVQVTLKQNEKTAEKQIARDKLAKDIAM